MKNSSVRASRWHWSIFTQIAVLICLLWVPGVGAGQAGGQQYLEDIKSLTAPQMEGRGDGTKGLIRAAQLIEKHYRSLGLQPAGKNGFFQPFTVVTGAQ